MCITGATLVTTTVALRALASSAVFSSALPASGDSSYPRTMVFIGAYVGAFYGWLACATVTEPKIEHLTAAQRAALEAELA
ncbi:MAG: hypothetical protein OEV29_13800, partial [Thermoleophilia bacterium]|nr:hypothetical protein [Thermoleophilia bacterium]